MPTTILLPIAGKAARFINRGYKLPKPLIPVNGIPMIRLALDSLIKNVDPASVKLLFIVRDDHCVDNDIINALKNILPEWDIDAISVDPSTQRGTLWSCLEAKDKISLDDPLLIYTPDVSFQALFNIQRDFVDSDLDGCLLTFKANSKDHSYAIVDQDNIVTATAEKKVISQNALVGVYGYKTGRMFIEYGERAIREGVMHNNEYYVAPMYNLLINDGLKIKIFPTEKMYVLGTPEDVDFYEKYVYRIDGENTVCLCCDHSGFELKEGLIRLFKTKGIKYMDFGAYSNGNSDHYDSLKPCIEHLLTNHNCIGLGICQTGQGFNIAANKVPGLRSIVAIDNYTAAMGRRHNAANFFCLPSRSVTLEAADGIITAIINNSFDGGRHATRILKISNDKLFTE